MQKYNTFPCLFAGTFSDEMKQMKSSGYLEIFKRQTKSEFGTSVWVSLECSVTSKDQFKNSKKEALNAQERDSCGLGIFAYDWADKYSSLELLWNAADQKEARGTLWTITPHILYMYLITRHNPCSPGPEHTQRNTPACHCSTLL